MGRKASEINIPFEAKPKDLPALATPVKDKDGDENEEEGGEGEREPFDWKKHLSKCIRLTRKAAIELGERKREREIGWLVIGWQYSLTHLFGILLFWCRAPHNVPCLL